MGETLIKVEGMSKKFCRSLKKSLWYGMQDMGSELLGKRHGKDGVLREHEFWALKDIDFEVKRGECLGLIGHNGAGKTTLLRMLNGLIKPDQGRIEMHGRVGALIALGAGFNPILTGRENVYVNAAVLGMSKQHVDKKIDEIIDFAEIEDFIDAPVQTYSSGMNVRLGFAVSAILLEPDILFLDEVLAVGDLSFILKCLNAVRELTNNAAVVFVSHNMQQISNFCTRVMVMDHGRVLADNQDPSKGIDKYYGLIKNEQTSLELGKAEVLSVELIVNNRELEDEEPTIPYGAELDFRIRLHIKESSAGANLYVNVMDGARSVVITMPIIDAAGDLNLLPNGIVEIQLSMGAIELAAGKYSLNIALTDSANKEILANDFGLCPFRITAEKVYWSKLVRHVIPKKIDILTQTV